MEPDVEEKQLRRAWKALSRGTAFRKGWHAIPLGEDNSHFFQAAVRFPEKHESILVSFDLTELPRDVALPKGKGFSLIRPDFLQKTSGIWLALCRHDSGDIEMFSRMAADILNVYSRCLPDRGELTFRMVLHRITAWQSFMKKAVAPLSIQEQLGLCGELEILKDLIAAGIGSRAAVAFWRGPYGELHDYVFPAGALEVKSTTNPLSIRISSAGQLDTAITAPLFLAVLDFTVDHTAGTSLAERIDETRLLLSDNISAQQMFDSCLINLGMAAVRPSWATEKFLLKKKQFFSVGSDFPALAASRIPQGISDVQYCISPLFFSKFSTTLQNILSYTGVFQSWNL